MALNSERKLSEDACRAATTRVVEEIARRRMSRRHLAELARISLSTLEKVLSGRRPLTLATLVRLEEALGVTLRANSEAPSALNGQRPTATPGVAPDELGNYARPAVQWIEGRYLTIRPSFGAPDAVYAYVTEIGWDDDNSCLAFREAERWDQDFTQFGQVAVPHQSGHVYLVTNRHGQYRLIIVSRPTINGEMHGILSTLKVGKGSQLTPIAAPIAFVPLTSTNSATFGQIGPGDTAYEDYRAILQRTTDDQFALLLG